MGTSCVGSDTMNSGFKSLNYAITPYIGGTDEGDSQGSTSTTANINDGDIVKLFIEGLDEVGEGSVMEARPQGEWLGVAIPINPWVYVLIQPHSINSEAQHYKLSPSQRGLSTLSDAVERTILWTVTHVVKSSGDVPLDLRPYICQDQWVGLEVHRRNSVGVLISSGQIMSWKENDHFQDGTLGEDHVGVTTLDIFVGSKEDLMTHA